MNVYSAMKIDHYLKMRMNVYSRGVRRHKLLFPRVGDDVFKASGPSIYGRAGSKLSKLVFVAREIC